MPEMGPYTITVRVNTTLAVLWMRAMYPLALLGVMRAGDWALWGARRLTFVKIGKRWSRLDFDDKRPEDEPTLEELRHA